MANPVEKEVRRKSVDDVRANLLRPSLTSYFAVQIPLPTNDGKMINPEVERGSWCRSGTIKSSLH